MSNTLSAIHGQKLVWLRFMNGNTKQDVVASALGMSQQEYSEYERGKRHFTEEIINRICQHYRIDIAEFLTPSGTGVIGDNNNNSIAGTNIHHNDMLLIESAHEAFKTALKSKDEMIAVLKDIIDGMKK